jgi:hypothetical protein
MKIYVVTFANTRADADLRVNASRHKFDTLREAREFAAGHSNAYITAIEAGEIVGYIKTRDELRRRRAAQ